MAYVEDLTNQEFVDLKRYFGDRPVMNLSLLLDEVMEHKKPLDWQAVVESPIPLKIVASSLTKNTSILLEGFRNK